MSQQTLFDNIVGEFFCFRSRYFKNATELQDKENVMLGNIFSLVERKSGTGVNQPGTVSIV